MLFIVLAHINITHQFPPHPHPDDQEFGVQSVQPHPDPDGHLYCVVDGAKLAGFINEHIACTLLYATL